MSWNPPKDKNKEQPKRRGVKGKQFNFIINQISLIIILLIQHGKMMKLIKSQNLLKKIIKINIQIQIILIIQILKIIM